MQPCNYCGRQIEFRYVDGVCKPIHIEGGGWCDGWSGGSAGAGYRSTVVVYRHADQDFCRPTRCPKCHAWVYFVRHNGGSVWFDELGWPWPKHGCFDDVSGHRILVNLSKHARRDDAGALWGMVVRTSVFADAISALTLLAIHCPIDTRLCVSLRGRYGGLNGQLILVQLDSTGQRLERLVDERGEELPISNRWLDPTQLELPANWRRICGRADDPPPPPKPVTPMAQKPVPKVTRPLPKVKKWVPRNVTLKAGHAMTPCPHCKVQVRATRLVRHILKQHNIRGTRRTGT